VLRSQEEGVGGQGIVVLGLRESEPASACNLNNNKKIMMKEKKKEEVLKILISYYKGQ